MFNSELHGKGVGHGPPAVWRGRRWEWANRLKVQPGRRREGGENVTPEQGRIKTESGERLAVALYVSSAGPNKTLTGRH